MNHKVGGLLHAPSPISGHMTNYHVGKYQLILFFPCKKIHMALEHLKNNVVQPKMATTWRCSPRVDFVGTAFYSVFSLLGNLWKLILYKTTLPCRCIINKLCLYTINRQKNSWFSFMISLDDAIFWLCWTILCNTERCLTYFIHSHSHRLNGLVKKQEIFIAHVRD